MDEVSAEHEKMCLLWVGWYMWFRYCVEPSSHVRDEDLVECVKCVCVWLGVVSG